MSWRWRPRTTTERSRRSPPRASVIGAGASGRLARDPHLLEGIVVVRFTTEAAVEPFELEPGDVDQALPLTSGRPPQRERADPLQTSAARDVDPAVRRHVGRDLPTAARALDPLAVERRGEARAEREDVPGESAAGN